MNGLIVLLAYVFVGLLLVALGFLFYLRSVASRRRHTCPECGEVQEVELMNASRCSTCGAPLGPGRS